LVSDGTRGVPTVCLTHTEFRYSGEEAGLLGSQAIAKSYKAAGTQVKAMMQLDMTA
jgi:leucyl aminopeptidase